MVLFVSRGRGKWRSMSRVARAVRSSSLRRCVVEVVDSGVCGAGGD